MVNVRHPPSVSCMGYTMVDRKGRCFRTSYRLYIDTRDQHCQVRYPGPYGFWVFLNCICMPDMLATRVRVAQQEEVCAGVAARQPRQHTPPSFGAGRSPARTTGETGPPKSPALPLRKRGSEDFERL